MVKEYFVGTLIEESLESKDILKKLQITKTEIEKVTEEHKTPWIKQWTLHTVKIPQKDIELIAKEISKSLDSKHNWYADFKTDNTHIIIYKNKIFKVERTKKEDYDKATKYGLSLGIPEYQLDFSSDVKPKPLKKK